MTSYTAIINSISSKTTHSTDHIISKLMDVEFTVRESHDKLLITEPNDGDGIVAYQASQFGRHWFVELLCSPYEDRGDTTIKDSEFIYELCTRILLDGGCVGKATHEDVDNFKCHHDAHWLIWEYDVIVLSNGKETITYYDRDDEGFSSNGLNMTYEEAEDSVFSKLYFGNFRVVFKGYREEVK